jgi:hypothetical protein
MKTEVVTVVLTIPVFRDTAPCRLVYRHQSYGAASCLIPRVVKRNALKLEAVNSSETFVPIY